MNKNHFVPINPWSGKAILSISFERERDCYDYIVKNKLGKHWTGYRLKHVLSMIERGILKEVDINELQQS